MSPARASALAVLLALTLILITAVSPAASHSGAAASFNVASVQPKDVQVVLAASEIVHTAVPGVSSALLMMAETPLLVVAANPVW